MPQATSEAARDRDRGARILRGAVLALAIVLTAFFAFVVMQRFRVPVDVEWMTGSIRDHVERVRDGKPLYAPPSADWIPFLYPPLYYWVSAQVARVCSIMTACRLVSLTSTIACAWLIARFSKHLGATRYWSAIAALAFIGSYAYVGYWFDIERCDSLFTAMLLAGAVVMASTRSVARAACGGAIIGAAFFAKQQALPVLAGGALALYLVKERARAIAFATAGAAIVAVGALALHVTTHGWFERYCLDVPAGHGLAAKLITVFFVIDLSNGFLFTATTFVVLAGATRQLRRGREDDAWSADAIVFAGILAGAFFSAASSRLHLGGWPNVLIPWVAFACIATALVASRVEATSPLAAKMMGAAMLLQLGHFAYDPMEASPDESRARYTSKLEARIHRLEANGEVVLVGQGNMTAHRHFHSAALVDLVRAGKPIPQDLIDAVKAQRFAAYVYDDKGEISFDDFLHEPGPLFEALASAYFVAERFDDKDPRPIIGWPEHPSWVLEPRRAPLAGLDVKALKRRFTIEMGLAEARMRTAQAGAGLPANDVEEAAARLDH